MTKQILLRVGQLNDGTGGNPLPNAAVLIEGDRIKAVLPQPPADLGEAVETHSFPTGTLLPGLIDAHVHLTVDPNSYDTVAFIRDNTDEQLYELGLSRARQFLQASVTTVRDLGARHSVSLRVRDTIAASQSAGAHVLAAGPVITTVKGHGYFLGAEVADDTVLAQTIERLLADGVDVIMLIGTGGGVTAGSDPTTSQFSAASLSLAVDLAHHAGRRVAVHAHSAAGIANCLDAGVDTIEHGTFVTSQGVVSDERLISRLA